jgi:Short chain fatty acid transporter
MVSYVALRSTRCARAGKQIPNLINPFWVLPFLGILGLKARDVVGFAFLQLLVHLAVVLVLLWLCAPTLPYIRRSSRNSLLLPRPRHWTCVSALLGRLKDDLGRWSQWQRAVRCCVLGPEWLLALQHMQFGPRLDNIHAA